MFDTGMVRDTQDGKPRFDLVFPKNVPYEQQMLTRFAQLMARGAEKYEERNWEKAATTAELDRARSSALRHLIQWYHGEEDEDHAAAVMFNLMAAEYVKIRMPSTDKPLVLGTFDNVCGQFNAALKTNCLRTKNHMTESTHQHWDGRGGYWVDGSEQDETPFTEPTAVLTEKPTTGGPYACEMAGAHTCSKHPGGWPGPTATGALKGS